MSASDKTPPEFNRATLEQWAKAAAKSAPGGDVAALSWVTPEGSPSSRQRASAS